MQDRKFGVLVFIFTLLLCVGTNCSGMKVAQDSSLVYAADANDATVIIGGCGNQPVVGYTYCRLHEGQDTSQFSLQLMAPPVQCKTKPCVTFKIFMPEGTPAWGVSVPDGQTQVTISWKDLLQRPAFVKNDRGFWPVIMEWHWIDLNGLEHQSAAEGEIRLRVLAAQYVPLNEVKADQNIVWKWSNLKTMMGMTTAGRAFSYPIENPTP